MASASSRRRARPDPAVPATPSVPSVGANEFQRDAYLAALTPPQFDLGGGRVLEGRILSADEWFQFEDRLIMAGKDQLTNDGLRALMIEMTDLTFPAITTGRFPFRLTTKPSTLLLALPVGARNAQFRSFTLAQAAAQEGTTRRASTATEPSPAHGIS